MHARGIFLLFEPGYRPDRAAIRDFVKISQNISLSFDPAATHLRLVGGKEVSDNTPEEEESHARVQDADWVELLFSGLAFDLHGLAPSNPVEPPLVANPFDFPSIEGAASLEPMVLRPGEHLAGGETSMPVVRGMMALARDITHHFEEVRAVAWPPAKSIVGRRFFESTVTAWLDGGAFPALGLTAFELSEDGSLQTVGLAHFIGQEMRIDPPLAIDPVAATRLGVRLVNQLVLTGGISEREQITAPDGARLAMEPSENGKIVRVWIE